MKLSEYQVMENQWYAFKTPDGLTCVLQRNGGYGCSGPIPGAPEGANLVSGGPGVPSFANSAAGADVGAVAEPIPARQMMPPAETVRSAWTTSSITPVESRAPASSSRPIRSAPG